MLKVRNNTNYTPFKIRDLIARGDSVGCTNLLNDNMFREIGTDWYYYITQTTDYRYNNLEPFYTNLITAFIYDNFKERVLLDKYSDEFVGWSESEDFNIYVEMIKRSVEYTLKSNTEKYNKLYYSMVAEFNPLWNVDGVEITERELRQTGTIEDSKTGTEESKKTGTETDTKTGTEGTETLGTETTTYSGSDTTTTAKTTYDSGTLYDTERTTIAKNTNDTKSIDTDTDTTYNTTDTLTHNTTDTLVHNTTDTLTHDTNNMNERDLTDNETIKITRQGNIGVTTTTKLLTEFREYADFNFINIVATDIVNSITFMTY